MPHTFYVDADCALETASSGNQDGFFELPMNGVLETRPALRRDADPLREDATSSPPRGDVVLAPGVGVAAPEGATSDF